MLPRKFVLCCKVLFYVAKIVCVLLPRFVLCYQVLFYVAKFCFMLPREFCVMLKCFVSCCEESWF